MFLFFSAAVRAMNQDARGSASGFTLGAASVAAAFTLAAVVGIGVDTTRRRRGSTKENDGRLKRVRNVNHTSFPPLRVFCDVQGILSPCFPGKGAEYEKGSVVISAFNYFAYFYPDIAGNFTEDERHAMNATGAVRERMIENSRASNLGILRGSSYWRSITYLSYFENWCLM